MEKTRFNSVENIGVSKIQAKIFELGWIFRTENNPDTGIDAKIEEVKDGIPTANYIGLQIKSGISHFHETKHCFTYYMTKIHAEYWLGANIPILLVAFLPELNKILWQEITEKNIIKTKTKWKIDIPKINEVNQKSLKIFSNLINFKIRSLHTSEAFNNSEQNTKYAYESAEIILKFNVIIELFGKYSNKYRIILTGLGNLEYNKYDKIVQDELRDYQTIIDGLTVEIYKNTDTYVYKLSKAIHYYIENREFNTEQIDFNLFSEKMEFGLVGLELFKSIFNKFYEPNIPKNIKVSLKGFETALECIIEEIKAAKLLVSQVLKSLENN